MRAIRAVVPVCLFLCGACELGIGDFAADASRGSADAGAAAGDASRDAGRLDAGAPTPDAGCSPVSCAAQGKNCGEVLNGCGAWIDCGDCEAPSTCGGGGVPNVCGRGGGSDAGRDRDAGLGGDAGAAHDAGSSADGGSDAGAGRDAGGWPPQDGGSAPGSPTIAGCPILPSNHIFNTPIDDLPVHPNSAEFLDTIGSHRVHLDLGTNMDMASGEFYGIPYNVVRGASMVWTPVRYYTADPEMTWDTRGEADCAVGSGHSLVSPCTAAAASSPVFPIPASPLVEGGIDRDPSQPYGDHHILMLDADACRLWELYHCYPGASGGWDIYGSATFDLRSNALRPKDWTSADAAGFPILPLLLRADEAQSGVIRHALRFTIESNQIRIGYIWPARHLTSNGKTLASQPLMGQLFRLKASYAIPAGANTQARAILQALKTYGMYLADGGSDLYLTGEPSPLWEDATYSVVQSVTTNDFEAVDLSPVMERAGFDEDSGAVPAP